MNEKCVYRNAFQKRMLKGKRDSHKLVANKPTLEYNMGGKGTCMTIEERIEMIRETNRGFLTRRDIDKHNIPSIYLTRYVKKHNLKQVTRGFYASDDWIVDPYLVFQYTYPQFIYSFSSAIYLHNLGDILPNYLEVTKPLNYHPFSKNRDDVVIHTDTVDSSYNLGVVGVVTSFANTVRAYDKEKTICDIIKNKGKIEFEVYVKALNNYARLKDKNINKLMEYAKIMKIENKVRSQMEVILNAF